MPATLDFTGSSHFQTPLQFRRTIWLCHHAKFYSDRSNRSWNVPV